MPLPILKPIPTERSGEAAKLPALPPGFRPVENLQTAWRAEPDLLIPARAEGDEPSVAQLNGLRYERKVREHFGQKVPKVVVGPWFFFRDKHGTRRCQPDMLFPLGGWTVIAEVKLNFTTDAWWQLRKLYEPVVQKALDVPTKCMVVTEMYDPAVPWPEEIYLMKNSDDVSYWLTKRHDLMGVLRWTL